MTYLESIGLTQRQSNYVLAVVRKAEDDHMVQSATIVRREGDVAIVERYGWNGVRLLDYPVRFPTYLGIL